MGCQTPFEFETYTLRIPYKYLYPVIEYFPGTGHSVVPNLPPPPTGENPTILTQSVSFCVYIIEREQLTGLYCKCMMKNKQRLHKGRYFFTHNFQFNVSSINSRGREKRVSYIKLDSPFFQFAFVISRCMELMNNVWRQLESVIQYSIWIILFILFKGIAVESITR